jgi:hypothetical protein
MLARKWFTGCLALVVLARGVHCLYTEVSVCALELAQHETQPLSDPGATDPNESGCLCKGATATAPCPTADLQVQSKLISPADIMPSPIDLVPQTQGEATAQDRVWPPPRSGNMLRAMFASWQI